MRQMFQITIFGGIVMWMFSAFRQLFSFKSIMLIIIVRCAFSTSAVYSHNLQTAATESNDVIEAAALEAVKNQLSSSNADTVVVKLHRESAVVEQPEIWEWMVFGGGLILWIVLLGFLNWVFFMQKSSTLKIRKMKKSLMKCNLVK